MNRFDVALLALAYAGFGNWWFCRMRAKVDSVYGPDSLAGAPVVKFLAHVAVMFVWPALFLVHAKMVAAKRAEFERNRYRARVYVPRGDVDAVLEEAVRNLRTRDVDAVLRGEMTFADAIGEAITATDLAELRDYVRRDVDNIYARWNGHNWHAVEMPGGGMGSHFERWQATNPPSFLAAEDTVFMRDNLTGVIEVHDANGVKWVSKNGGVDWQSEPRVVETPFTESMLRHYGLSPDGEGTKAAPGVGASLAEMEAHHGSALHPSAFDADHDNGEFPKPPRPITMDDFKRASEEIERERLGRYQNGLNCSGELCDDPAQCPHHATCSMHSNGGR